MFAARIAAVMAATGFALVAIFQVSLALGTSWGRAAWGGVYEMLPPGLRIASAISAIVLMAAAPDTGVATSRSASSYGAPGCSSWR